MINEDYRYIWFVGFKDRLTSAVAVYNLASSAPMIVSFLINKLISCSLVSLNSSWTVDLNDSACLTSHGCTGSYISNATNAAGKDPDRQLVFSTRLLTEYWLISGVVVTFRLYKKLNYSIRCSQLFRSRGLVSYEHKWRRGQYVKYNQVF